MSVGKALLLRGNQYGQVDGAAAPEVPSWGKSVGADRGGDPSTPDDYIIHSKGHVSCGSLIHCVSMIELIHIFLMGFVSMISYGKASSCQYKML